MNSKLRLVIAAAACAPLLATATPEPTGSAPMAQHRMEADHRPMPRGPQEGPMMAQGPRGEGPAHRGMGPHAGPAPAIGLPTPPWLMGVKLTEAQEDKIFKVVYDELPQMRDQMKAMHQAHEALRKLPFSEKFDSSEVKSLTTKLAQISTVMEASQATTQNKIWKVLTPEQRKEISARMAHREGGRDMPPPSPMNGHEH